MENIKKAPVEDYNNAPVVAAAAAAPVVAANVFGKTTSSLKYGSLTDNYSEGGFNLDDDSVE